MENFENQKQKANNFNDQNYLKIKKIKPKRENE